MLHVIAGKIDKSFFPEETSIADLSAVPRWLAKEYLELLKGRLEVELKEKIEKGQKENNIAIENLENKIKTNNEKLDKQNKKLKFFQNELAFTSNSKKQDSKPFLIGEIIQTKTQIIQRDKLEIESIKTEIQNKKSEIDKLRIKNKDNEKIVKNEHPSFFSGIKLSLINVYDLFDSYDGWNAGTIDKNNFNSFIAKIDLITECSDVDFEKMYKYNHYNQISDLENTNKLQLSKLYLKCLVSRKINTISAIEANAFINGILGQMPLGISLNLYAGKLVFGALCNVTMRADSDFSGFNFSEKFNQIFEKVNEDDRMDFCLNALKYIIDNLSGCKPENYDKMYNLILIIYQQLGDGTLKLNPIQTGMKITNQAIKNISYFLAANIPIGNEF